MVKKTILFTSLKPLLLRSCMANNSTSAVETLPFDQSSPNFSTRTLTVANGSNHHPTSVQRLIWDWIDTIIFFKTTVCPTDWFVPESLLDTHGGFFSYLLDLLLHKLTESYKVSGFYSQALNTYAPDLKLPSTVWRNL